MRCPSCSAEVAEEQAACARCGAPMPGPSARPTEAIPRSPDRSPAPHSSAPASLEGGRFLPGTVLDGRYRIIGLLGRGGMGEVYRADDLKLGQAVALKFLPADVQQTPERLERFLNEVKLARQVAHPHVCRVYDVGETSGQHYLSMEYVDGEDLASLLRRIGRLPEDKAVQIARQICAGLSAAHKLGILHRDLKPANVMLDGRGHAKITDFGLASLAEKVEGAEALAGTPAYMAPEQLAGTEATLQSDLYSLGLLLYELFTGKRAFDARNTAEMRRLQKDSAPTAPSSHVSGMDTAVERVILRCLENDPAARPPSALSVAAALPGGDPLAAALAAGETPSPELVAAAGTTDPVSVKEALAYLLIAMICMGATVAIMNPFSLHKITSLEKAPAVLENQARQIVELLEPGSKVIERAHGFESRRDLETYLLDNTSDPAERRSRLGQDLPSVLQFWYRESARPMTPTRPNYFGRYGFNVTPRDPALAEPGMTRVTLSPGGKLTSYRRLPLVYPDLAPPAPPFEWSTVFTLAGLDIANFASSEPRRTPATPSDARFEWTGTFPAQPEMKLRVVAASLAGRPVYFELLGPWEIHDRDSEAEAIRSQDAQRERRQAVTFAMIGITLLICAPLAWRNVRLGRWDRRGAGRLVIYLLCMNLAFWLFNASRFSSIGNLGTSLLIALGWALTRALDTGLLYIALEPHIRKHLPHGMISWSRLLSGQWRDPLVGRDILRGLATVAVMFLLVRADGWLIYGSPLGDRVVFGPELLSSPLRGFLAGVAVVQNGATGNALTMVFVLILFRALLRRWTFAGGAWVLLFSLLPWVGQSAAPALLPLLVSITAITLFVIRRFGLLSLITVGFVQSAAYIPVTLDADAWYAPTTYLACAIFLALALFAFYTAIGGQRLFKEDLLST